MRAQSAEPPNNPPIIPPTPPNLHNHQFPSPTHHSPPTYHPHTRIHKHNPTGYVDVATCFVINSPEALRKIARGRPVLGIDINMRHGFSENGGQDGGRGLGPAGGSDDKTSEVVTFSVKRGSPIDLNLSGGSLDEMG